MIEKCRGKKTDVAFELWFNRKNYNKVYIRLGLKGDTLSQNMTEDSRRVSSAAARNVHGILDPGLIEPLSEDPYVLSAVFSCGVWVIVLLGDPWLRPSLLLLGSTFSFRKL